DHQLVALRELRADRGRQAEAHRAHRAGGEPMPWCAEIEILRRPHLVLADAGADDGAALGVAVDRLDHRARLDQRAGAIVVYGVQALARADVAGPEGEGRLDRV